MLILITRPEPAAARTASRLRALGHEALTDPMLIIHVLMNAAQEMSVTGCAVLAFTSVNAVRAFAAHPECERALALPVYSVGGRTAQEALATGFTHVIDGGGDARTLTALMARELPAGTRVLYPAGRDRAADLPAVLAPHGITVQVLEVYEARAAEHLSTAAHDALAAGRIDGVMHFSQRTAAAFLACVDKSGLHHRLAGVRHLCLSAQVAGPLIEAGLSVSLAGAPDEDALFALL